MTDRILDLSESSAHLSVWNGLLKIERREQPAVTVPFEEVAVVVGAHRELTFTQAFFSRLAANKGVFVACNEKSLPVAFMLPIEGHHLQAEQFSLQAQASEPLKKRMWQAVVKAKIRAQACVLAKLRGSDYGLLHMASRVRSGDTDNMEGQASRRYWPHLFEDDPQFRRDRDVPGRNALLNFGYAILRAVTARAVCAAGLHPSLGIHHHNRYDAYVLADDLMEPFRPMVDIAVARYATAPNTEPLLDREAKRALYQALRQPVLVEGEQRTLFDALARLCASVVRGFRGEGSSLVLPE